MKLIFNFGAVIFAYTQNILWWGSIENVTMQIDKRVVLFTDYLGRIKKL